MGCRVVARLLCTTVQKMERKHPFRPHGRDVLVVLEAVSVLLLFCEKGTETGFIHPFLEGSSHDPQAARGQEMVHGQVRLSPPCVRRDLLVQGAQDFPRCQLRNILYRLLAPRCTEGAKEESLILSLCRALLLL